jgi:hypothetical protein
VIYNITLGIELLSLRNLAMENLFPVVIILAIVAVAIIGTIWGKYAERKRTEQVRQAAKQLGLTFNPMDDAGLLSELSSLRLFTQGHSRKIKNIVHGETDQVEIGIFDYQYTTGSGKNAKTRKHTVIYFESPDLQLPQFAMRPENLFHKLGSLVGLKDIDFDSHPVFSRAFHLQGEDEPSVRQLFREEILSQFENHTGVCVEGRQRQLIYFRSATRVAPEEIRSFMEEGFKVFSLMRSSTA